MRIVKSLLAIIIISAAMAAVYLYFSRQEGQSLPQATQGTQVSEDNIILNEFMASNGSFLPDDQGKYSDWIEVYNPGASAVNLFGYGLSNDKGAAKWNFPAVTLDSGAFLLVFASGDSSSDPEAAFHAGFKLSADKGSVYLLNAAGSVIDSREYKDQFRNESFGRDPVSSQWTVFDKPTPGFSNDEAGYEAFRQSRLRSGSGLIITEVMPSNKTVYADNKGKYSDWIEVYNAGEKPVDLTGYGLTDDPDNVPKWKFPSITIEAGEYLVVFASGEGENSTDLASKAVHTDFRISAYKEELLLSDSMGYILDEVSVSEVPPDYSYARTIEGGAYTGQWTQTKNPTPGQAN